MTHAELDTDAAGEIDAIDQETRAREDDHEALRVWLRLLTCTNLVESRLRNLLRGGFDCTLPASTSWPSSTATPRASRCVNSPAA